MPTSYPFVSLVIPTHNRSSILPRTLAALSRQSYPADRMEVFLVADGCTDDTLAVAGQFRTPWKMKILEQSGLGAAAARNRGILEAVGQVLIFIDDDMEVTPEFVMSHVAVLQGHPKTVSIGVLRLPDQSPKKFLERSIRDWWENKFFRMRQPGYRFRYDDFFGGNFSVWADFFREVGCFDPELRCHEDYEAGVRLLDAGAIVRLAEDAVAVHHDVTDLQRSFRRRIAEGVADVYLVRRHPGLHWGMPLTKAPYSILGRALRYLAFRQWSLGTWFIQGAQFLLPMLEWFWLLGFWQILFYHLQEYWYWLGVGSVSQPDTIRNMFAQKNVSHPAPIIDLSSGLSAVEHSLDTTRPASVRFFLGRFWIGDIPDLPGMERLRKEHVRRILATEFPEQLTLALRMKELCPPSPVSDVDQEAEGVWSLPPEPKISADHIDRIITAKKIVEIDLQDGVPNVDISGYSGLYVFVRSGDRMLGSFVLTKLAGSVIPAGTLYEAIVKRLDLPILQTAWDVSSSSPVHLPSISVIVCTRNRTAQLAECLQALIDMDYPQFEILVVDNAPSDERTAELTAGLPVRYIREHRPGLDWARNRGIREARYPVVAFTDDDARPEPGWLKAIASAFVHQDVMAVTGPVLPAVLETKSQNLFELSYGGMNHGFVRRVFRSSTAGRKTLLWASSFGAGANMAFRKKVFELIGEFDPALDVGTPSGGGGDVEMFHRLVARGHVLVYEPSALVWHQHRSHMSDLEKLMENNGRSFGCYLVTVGKNGTIPWFFLVYFALRFWLWDWIFKRLIAPDTKGIPRSFIRRELLLALSSPMAYLNSRAHASRVGAVAPQALQPPLYDRK